LMGYTGEKSTRTRKDDIPDAMAHIGRYLPSSAPLTPKEQEEKAAREESLYSEWLQNEQYRIMFGDRGPSIVPPTATEEPIPSSPLGGISGRLFGNNGMRA
jgi:hypothetical protein